MIMQRKRSFEQLQAQTQIRPDRLSGVDACWRAANYLGVAQLYLRDNVLLRRPLRPEDIKSNLEGQWGSQPGLNLVYVHLNRLIQDSDANILLVVGPGHAGPSILANLYLEGTLCEYYPQLERDEPGANELARQFGWPDGVPDHLAPQTPGMIQRGGQPGASLAHAVGAVFDNPDLIAACVIGDDEAETGNLLAAWPSNRFLNPVRDGAVLPILHLGGYRAAGPSILGRMDNDELDNLLTGLGYQIGIVAGDDPHKTHEAMWQAMDWAFHEIRDLQEQMRAGGAAERPVWPMLILRTPTGWTCPREVDGQLVEGTFRAHGLPVPEPRGNPEHLKILEQWLRSYDVDALFDEAGRPVGEVLAICPAGDRRIGRNPHANGGQLRVDLKLPDPGRYAVEVSAPGAVRVSGVRQLGEWLADVFRENQASQNFRLLSPDDTVASRMAPVLEATSRAWIWPIVGTDEQLAFDGRILEIGSEATCEGWLEGYLLTGRHGLLACGEKALAMLEPMLVQHALWLEGARRTAWRKPVASLTCLLVDDPVASGAGLQPSGLLANLGGGARGSAVHVYLPPDANSLLCVLGRCLRSSGQINVVYASGVAQPQWLAMDAAQEQSGRGASVWEWAGSGGGDPEVVLAAAGTGQLIETLAAAQLLRRRMADLRLRVVSVVDPLSLLPRQQYAQGLEEREFASLFGGEAPVILACHGYAGLIHELIHERPGPGRFHVHGYIKQGRAATPFDHLVRNRMSRFHLAIAAIEQVARLREAGGPLIEQLRGRLVLQDQSIRQRNQDLPEIGEWRWE